MTGGPPTGRRRAFSRAGVNANANATGGPLGPPAAEFLPAGIVSPPIRRAPTPP